MAALGYYSGDPHLHFPRKTEADDRGHPRPARSRGHPLRLDPGLQRAGRPVHRRDGDDGRAPAPRPGESLGPASRRRPGSPPARSTAARPMAISTSTGAMTWCSKGQKVNANNWPLYGQLGRETTAWADSPSTPTADMARRSMPTSSRETSTPSSSSSSASIAGSSWPTGTTSSTSAIASPASGRATIPPAASWAIAGRMSTCKIEPGFAELAQGRGRGAKLRHDGPVLLLDVDGERPGGIIRKTGTGPHRVRARVRVTSEVAPVQTVQMIVNGKVVHEQTVPAGKGQGSWIELDRSVRAEPFVVDRGAGVRASSFGQSRRRGAHQPGLCGHRRQGPVRPRFARPPGRADRPADGRAPQAELRREGAGAGRLSEVARHPAANPPDGGLPAGGVPDDWIDETTTAAIDASRRTHTDPSCSSSSSRLPAKTPDEALEDIRDRGRVPHGAGRGRAAGAKPGRRGLRRRRQPLRRRDARLSLQAQARQQAAGYGPAVARHRRRRPVRPEPRLRRRPALGCRHRTVERRRVRHGAARHLVLEGHRRRWQGRRAQQGLHRLRHAEPAGDGQQPDLGPGPLDLRRGGGQRRDDPPGR